MNNNNLYSPKLPTIVVDPFYSCLLWGEEKQILTFRHLVFISLQLIDNYSVAEIIGKNTFYLLVCKESFELEAETESFWDSLDGLGFLN